MSIKSTGNFSGGNVAAPDLGASVRAFSDVANQVQQKEQNEIANARALEQLALQKQQFGLQQKQYDDAQKDKQGIQELYKQLVKPKQVANAATMWAQTDKTPDMFKAAAFTDEEMAAQGMQKDYSGEWKQSNMPVGPIPEALKASILQKQKMQEGIAAQALTPTEAQLETRSQQIERSLKDMSDKGITIPTAAYQELDKARLADKVAQTEKEKQIDEQLKELRKSRDENIGKAAAGYDKVYSNGLSVGDDGSITVGNPQGVKAMQAAYTDKINKEKGYQDAVGSIDGAINKVAKDSKVDIKPEDATKIKTLATETINALVAGGVDSKVASELVSSGISAGNNNWFWNAKDAGFTKPTKEILEPLMLSGKNIQELEKQKAALSVGNTIPRGSMVYDVGTGLAKNAENEIATLKAQKALLQTSPEERQFATTKSRLDELLNPKTAAPEGSASISKLYDSKTGNITKTKDFDKTVDNVITVLTNVREVKGKNGEAIPVKLGEAQIWGIVGNGIAESGFDSNVVGDRNLGAGKEAHGVMQWRLDRADALRSYAGEKNIAKIPLETQLKFAVQEMYNRPPVDKKSFSNQLEEYMSIKDPKEAASYISANYEVAKGNSTRENEAVQRGAFTEKLYTDNQKAVASDWTKSDKDKSVIASYKQDLVDAIGSKDFDTASVIGARLKAAGISDDELQKLARSSTNTTAKANIPISNAGAYLRGDLPAPDAPNFDAAKVAANNKPATGWIGEIEKRLSSREGSSIMNDVNDWADRLKQGGAAAVGGIARTGEFFSHALDPITTSVSGAFDTAATAAEKEAKNSLLKRGATEQEAERAVALQGVLVPTGGGLFSKLDETAKIGNAKKLNEITREAFTRAGKPKTLAEAEDVVVKLKKEEAGSQAVAKSREEILEEATKRRIADAKIKQRVEELSGKENLSRTEQLELNRLEALLK